MMRNIIIINEDHDSLKSSSKKQGQLCKYVLDGVNHANYQYHGVYMLNTSLTI